MIKKLKLTQILGIASLLFGMMFGAGNLIFPIHMGQLAGNNYLIASIGFIATAVGVPLLGVISIGVTYSKNMKDLALPIGKLYSFIFTIILYLTIGPFFCIPRCATVAFTVGIEGITGDSKMALLIFSFVFFAVVLFFSLKPSEILTWIGKIINPAFLIFFGLLLAVSIIKPMGAVAGLTPIDTYNVKSFANGFVEGYGTMDAIACLAFGIVIIDVIKGFGVNDDKSICVNLIYSGIYCCVLMAIIYLLSTYTGAVSRNIFEVSSNGGIALREVSNHYFGKIGNVLLAIIVTLATLKTSIGLVTSISEMFHTLFPNFITAKMWSIVFTVFSFAVANVGLTAIINYAIPVLMLLYPLTITVILLGIFSKFFKNDHKVYKCVTIGAFVAAVFDMLNTLPEGMRIEGAISFASKVLPLFDKGLSWIVPSFIGLIIGLILHFAIKEK